MQVLKRAWKLFESLKPDRGRSGLLQRHSQGENKPSKRQSPIRGVSLRIGVASSRVGMNVDKPHDRHEVTLLFPKWVGVQLGDIHYRHILRDYNIQVS